MTCTSNLTMNFFPSWQFLIKNDTSQFIKNLLRNATWNFKRLLDPVKMVTKLLHPKGRLQGYLLSQRAHTHREVTTLSKLETTCKQKKSTFSKLHHQNGSKFDQIFFMSTYCIHGIYNIVKIDNLIWLSVFKIKHTVSN